MTALVSHVTENDSGEPFSTEIKITIFRVFDDIVSGAPETAPIEQSVCCPPPPAVHGHPPAPCGMAPTCLGLVAPLHC